MKSVIIVIGIFFALIGLNTRAGSWQPSAGHTQVPIWPGPVASAVPASESETVSTTSGNDVVAGKPYLWVEKVSQPTLTVYSPKGVNTGVAMVVFPGGGYQGLAIDLEGTEACDWLVSKGITCVLLKYRVPNSGPSWGQGCGCNRDTKSSMPLEDAQRSIGLVRFNAAKWHIDPHKIGVLGFSAGGYLVAAISTHFEKRLYTSVDAADEESIRPDFAVAVFPGHLWIDDDKFELNPEIRVTHDTPPTFLIQAEDDGVDDVNNSLVYYKALKEAKVPAELHLYAQGGHAFGLRRTNFQITRWPQLVETWLGEIGMNSR